ncbi:UDP-glycosyltransferase-15 [Ephemera danica]|nr:UDP-glycosyltransferase-15 [Ephemera danica]
MFMQMRWLLLLLMLASMTQAARILGIFPTPARSHSRVFEVLMKELASRGHHVTFVSPIAPQLAPPSNSSSGSFNHIFLEGSEELLSGMDQIIGPDRSPLKETIGLWHVAPKLCEKQLASKELQPLLRDKSIEFDLVIVEVFFFDCMIPFARHFNAPLVGFVSFWTPPWGHAMVANPYNLAISPNFFLPYVDKMNYFERLHNVLHTTFTVTLRQWLFLPHQDAVARRYFGDNTPPIAELELDTSLFLSNTHPAMHFPFARVPSMIEVGGIHILPAKALPKDLAKFLDESRKGVVIFSLGSMINNDNLPPERLQLLTKTMAALPYPVIWRWDTIDVPGLTPNVRVEKWMPQRDMLAHPNVRLLVTHGGLLSALEAATEGVPRLVLPFFGDQHMNALKAVQDGVALSLEFYTASPEQLINASMRLLSEPSFREAAMRLSKLVVDQPEKPLERAVFWTEYVLRHNGAHHLQSAAKQLSWHQLHLLDVFAVVLAVLISTFLVLRALVRLICCAKHQSPVVKKKKVQ